VARQDRAPLSWTNERADTLFVRVSEEGSGSKARSSRASAASAAIDIARAAGAKIEVCTPTSWRISFAGARR
jgi:hypothetical protein